MLEQSLWKLFALSSSVLLKMIIDLIDHEEIYTSFFRFDHQKN